jgi:hypothetical protein
MRGDYVKLVEDLLPGGLADDKTVQDLANKYDVDLEYAKKQLEDGIKVEREHTDNDDKAKEIALDHLYGEGISYYIELAKMEKELETDE